MSLSTRDRCARIVRTAATTAADALPARPGFEGDERGVTEALAVVLLLGIAAIGISAILLYGNAVVQSYHQTTDVAHAENAFDQLDTHARQVALGESQRQELELGLRNDPGVLRTEDSGWMRIEFVDTRDGVSTVVANVSLGAVEYENRQTRVAYQGGGVWRVDNGNSVMVSPPSIRFDNGTLSMSVISLEGDGSVYSRLAVTSAGADRRVFPNASIPQANKLASTKLIITVKSHYHGGWASFFREETNALVYEQPTEERVQVTFLAAPEYVTLRNGLTATAGTGRLALAGTGAYTDSYNSTEGPYAVTKSGNGTIWAANDVLMTGGSEVNGSVRSGGTVDLDGNALVDGDVYWTEEFDTGSDSTVTGTVSQIDGVAAIEPINGFVEMRVDQIRDTNDNDETSAITDGSLKVGTGETVELTAGTYYADQVHVKGGDLVLNTTDGDITLAVQDYVYLERKGGTSPDVTVVGNGTVSLYVAAADEVKVTPTGLGSRDVNFHVPKGGSVTVPNQHSPQLRIFSTSDFVVTIAGSNSSKAHFEGAIYAPGGMVGDGYVYVKQANVYGGIITSNLTLGQYGAVHYDTALGDVKFPLSPSVSRIEYLYATVHPIDVKDARARE